jgi:transposase-like protein
MAKNTIQFQKGLSLSQFLSFYGTEEQCRAALFRMRWPQGFHCPKCDHGDYCEIHSRKVYQCSKCHAQTSLIQGTIFASTKLPLTIWMLGIYLVTQAKDGVSSLNLGRTLGISANAALRMKHKLQQVMKNRDDQRPLRGVLLIDDAYWGGKKRDGKRGRGASGKTPLVAALSLSPEGYPVFLKLNQVNGFTKEEICAWSAKSIRPGSLVVSDGLCCFSGVTQAQCTHEAIVTHQGGRYNDRSIFQWLNTVLGNVKNALHGTYHAVSQKHLPRYLAEFCYRFNRRFQLHTMVNRLAYQALRNKPIPQRLLKLAELRW